MTLQAEPEAPPVPLRKNTAYLRYWLSRRGSAFAFQMISVAVGWQIYEITKSAFALGLIGLTQFTPSVLLALYAGHLADQANRRTIVIVCQAIEMVAALLLAWWSYSGSLGEYGILSLVFVLSAARAFEFPTQQAVLPGLVPTKQLAAAMTADAGGSQIAMIAGPALGGALYVAGPSVVYGTAGTLYALAVSCMWGVPVLHHVRKEVSTLESMFSGVRFIRERRVILGVLSLDLFAVLFGGATALLPIFASDILHTGPVGLGLLRAAPAVGALSMSIWLSWHPLRRAVGKTMFACVAGFGVATVVFGVSKSLELSLAALFLLGAFDMVSMVVRSTLVQLETPDEMRGRVSAVNAIFINTSNQLGEFESGMLAALVGAVGAAWIGGLGTLVVVGLWMWMFPELRHRETLEGDEAVL